MLNIKKTVFAASATALAALPFLAFGQSFTPPPPTSITSVSAVTNVLSRIVGFMQVLLFAAAGVFIVLAAFQYLTAGGDEEKVKEARQKLVYAMIAIAIGLVATGIGSVVKDVIGN